MIIFPRYRAWLLDPSVTALSVLDYVQCVQSICNPCHRRHNSHNVCTVVVIGGSVLIVVAPLVLCRAEGAGMILDTGFVEIEDCEFGDNFASKGGAITLLGNTNQVSVATIRNTR